MKKKNLLAEQLAEKTFRELQEIKGNPVNSRKNPVRYGTIRKRLREYTGRNIQARDLTYEAFIEFVNKTDYLLKNAVFGLQEKIIMAEKNKL